MLGVEIVTLTEIFFPLHFYEIQKKIAASLDLTNWEWFVPFWSKAYSTPWIFMAICSGVRLLSPPHPSPPSYLGSSSSQGFQSPVGVKPGWPRGEQCHRLNKGAFVAGLPEISSLNLKQLRWRLSLSPNIWDNPSQDLLRGFNLISTNYILSGQVSPFSGDPPLS